jgi:hypothetical protein
MEKRIYNKTEVVTGLVIFLLLAAFPVMWNFGAAIALGKVPKAPEPKLTERAEKAKVCVRETEWMKGEHMQLLDVWRDTVVRDMERKYLNTKTGHRYEMSLSNGCLECHSNKEEFCDACHNYTSVRPYCWDCHIENPKEDESER